MSQEGSHTSQELPTPEQTLIVYRCPRNRQFWCFDDERFELVQKLLDNGASDFLSRIVGADCDHARLIFSTSPFPGHNIILESEWNGKLPEQKGCSYRGLYNPRPDGSGEFGNTLWLCPELCNYFGKEKAPDKIYAQITPAKSSR